MNKVEYSDLYRFLTSLGVGCLIVPFFLQWAVLQEVKSVNEGNIQLLLLDSRNYVSMKHGYIIAVTDYLSISSFVLGIILISVGGWKWYERQQVIDQMENFNLDEKIKSGKQVTEDEKIQTHFEEMSSELNEDRNQASNTTGPEADLVIQKDAKKYYDVEQEVTKLITSVSVSNLKVHESIKINSSEFDVLLESQHGKNKHYDIFEIKYYPKKIFYSFLNQGVGRFILSALNLVDSRSRLEKEVSLYMVWVFKDKTQENTIRTYADRCQKEAESKGYKLKVFVAHEDSIEDLRREIQGSIFWR